MQVVTRIALKYFLNKDYNIETLDKLMNHKVEYYTNVSQMLPLLHDAGLEVKDYSGTDIKRYLEGESYIRELCGADADHVLTKLDMPVLIASVETVLKYDLVEIKTITVDDLEEAVKNGTLPLVSLNWNILYEKEGPLEGHIVAMTGFDDESIYYHESGPTNPTPNKKADKKLFAKAAYLGEPYQDIVFVYGKRNDFSEISSQSRSLIFNGMVRND